MITKLSSMAQAKIHFEFSNGGTISVVWGPLTYSDNHDNFPIKDIGKLKQNVFGDGADYIESTTYEVMAVDCSDEFIEWFTNKYGENPIGYVPVTELMAMLQACDNWKPSQVAK